MADLVIFDYEEVKITTSCRWRKRRDQYVFVNGKAVVDVVWLQTTRDGAKRWR